MNGFSTLNRLLGKKNKDVSKSTSNLSKASMDSSSQINKIMPLPSMTNAPFEQTFRITVLLPRDQLYVTRIGAKTKLDKLLELVCADKLLDKNKYDFRHPADPMERFDKDLTIGEVGLSEIRLVSKTESLQTEHFNRFSSSDLYKFHKQNERESLSSSDKSRHSKHNQLLLKTTSPYSSTNSLNSMDSSGLSSSSKGGGGGTHQPPVAPTRKKRTAPRPPSQNSIPEKDVVPNHHHASNGGAFKEPLPVMPRKNFHVSSPNLYNNNNNNNISNVNLNHNQYFEESTKSETYKSNSSMNENNNSSVYNKNDAVSVMNKKNNSNGRPASLFIMNSTSEGMNGTGGNGATLQAASSMINISHSRTSSESSECKDLPEPTPRKRLLSATKKKIAPAPPPRRIVPVPSPRAAIKSEMKLKQIEEDTNGTKNGDTVSPKVSRTDISSEGSVAAEPQSPTASESSQTLFKKCSLKSTSSSPPLSPTVSVEHTSRPMSPAITPTTPTATTPANNNISKVMLNVDNTTKATAEPDIDKDVVNGPVSIQIVKTTGVQPAEETRQRQTSPPIVSKVMLNTNKANYDSSDEGESSGSDKVNVYNVKLAKSITTIAQINNSNLTNSYEESDAEEATVPAVPNPTTTEKNASSENVAISQRRASEEMLHADEITSLSESQATSESTVAVAPGAVTTVTTTTITTTIKSEESAAETPATPAAAPRSPSPLWTYTLPAPPNFADKYSNGETQKKGIAIDVTSNVDTQTVISDTNRTYIIDDVDIRPIIKERLTLNEDLYMHNDNKTASSSSTTSTPTSTLIDNESNNSSTDIITSDIEDGYHGGNVLHKNLLKFNHDELNKRRDQLIESEFEFLTNIDDGSDDYNNENNDMEMLNNNNNNKPNNHSNNNNNVNINNNNNHDIVDKKNFINELNSVINNKDEFNSIIKRLSSHNDNSIDDKFVTENNKRNSISNFKITTYSHSNSVIENNNNIIHNNNNNNVKHNAIYDNNNDKNAVRSTGTVTTATTMANRELINFKKDVEKLCNSGKTKNIVDDDDENEKVTPIKRNSLQSNPLPLFKSKSRSDSFHSTRPDYLMRSQSHNNNLNLMTPRSTSYISLIGAQKFESRHRTNSSHSINRRNSATELTISQSPSLQSLEVLKNILSSSRKNSLNVESDSLPLKREEVLVNESHSIASPTRNHHTIEEFEPEVVLREKRIVLVEKEPVEEAVVINVPNDDKVSNDEVNVPEKEVIVEKEVSVVEEPKKWKYQGPPMINLSTWSERPKIDVSIKSDKDYKFGGNTTLPRGFKNTRSKEEMNGGGQDVVDTAAHRFTVNANTIREMEMEMKSSTQNRLSLQPSYNNHNGRRTSENGETESGTTVNRLPIVRGVEYKKNIVPPLENVAAPTANPEVVSPRNSSTYFYDNFSKPISSTNGVTANNQQEIKVTHSTPIVAASAAPSITTITSSTTTYSFTNRISTSLSNKFTPVVKGFKLDASTARNDKNDNEESDDSGFKSLPSNNVSKSISVTNLTMNGVMDPPSSSVVGKFFNKPPEIAKKPTIVTLRNHSQTAGRDTKPAFRMSTYESVKKIQDEGSNVLPFSQNTLRKTGLKDKILAEPANEAKSASNGNVTVTRLDHVALSKAPTSKPTVATAPPPPPPIVPVVRAVVTKRPSSAAPAEADVRGQLLDAIRNFNRTSLKKD